mgnify:CR=1 FL=1|jgi:N utilization substance protein B
MSRRQAREAALQALFQLDLNNSDGRDEAAETRAVDAALEEGVLLPARDRDYVRDLVHGTNANLEAIDALITENSREWKVERMSGIDRNVTRLAIYEMKFSPEKLTPNIVINEAVELAKKFGTDDSGRFVNGILGAMVR